ncbi:hypothetical protein BWO91_02045 [Plantibacter flavus]|uniref:apiosidase-like domain-containing protein n=1 Tax=Plantibacter flavus TaxID=150123 RepID=UPI0009C3A1B6|nr:DUF4038 domain-containing protein [Plantibacter flavus]AQX78942.1 hypothetical protein BWO91_02045 [Plantibacter flavus]
MNRVEQWTRHEVQLTSTQEYAHPDTDVSITAHFRGPSGQVIELPGFWDGGDAFAVRFAPTETGRWTYTVTASDETNAGLHRVTGELDAVPYTGDHAIYRHGFIRESDDRRAFVYADGTPFFWLGNTHWQAANYERLDTSNNPYAAGTSQFHSVVDSDQARGFTVYQTYPDAAVNDGGGNVPVVNWWAAEYTHLDPDAFRDQFDVMMDYIADQGIVIALGLGVHTQSGQIGPVAMTHFTRYVLARYAAHPIIWITGQEVDIEDETAKLSTWQAVAETIAANDGYHRPLGAHMWAIGEPKVFGDQPWHTWYPTQGGHDSIRTQEHYRSYWDERPTKPFLETEANYEDIWAVTVDDTRHSAWKALQCGSYGYTYGVAGVWAIKWDYDVPGWDDFQNGIPWFDGIRKPGGDQMGILRRFYETLGDWQRLLPRYGDHTFGTFAHPEESVLSSDGNSRYVVYFYQDDLATGSLHGLGEVPYLARWFDPATGEWTTIPGDVDAPAGTWAIPDKPDRHDWVLVVEAADMSRRRLPERRNS